MSTDGDETLRVNLLAPPKARVHILFLDESGKPSDRTFAVGGVAVAGDQWAELRDRWETALAAHNWPIDREAKWHGIRTGEVPPALADALYKALSGAPITYFVVVLRPLAGRKQNDGWFRWHKQLLPQFARHPATGKVDGVGLKVYPSRLGEPEPPTKLFTE